MGKALGWCIRNECEKGVQVLRVAEEKIEQRGVGDPEALYKIAQAYGLLGDRAAAIRMLRTSIAGGFFAYPYLANDPLLHDLRGEAEFGVLMGTAKKRYELFKRKFL